MAAVMLLCVMSAGMIGAAAEFDANTQYTALANALKNDYVADLTNYTLSNTALNNGAEGFVTEANGFAYEHRITAKDNSAGDILRAANRFYYILENIMSTEYGAGLYEPSMIHTAVTAKLKPYFEGSSEPFYVDFYGERYEPTAEELAEYENAISLLEAVGREVTPATLSSFRIYFMEKDEYSFYNVDTIIQYFLGNALKINAGNWYHKFVFVVSTSLDTWLTEAGNINNFADSTIVVRDAVYELNYARTYNETQTKAYYAFKQPTLAQVWEDFADEFGFDNASSNLMETPIAQEGQAAAFMIKESNDTETIPYLRTAYGAFTRIENGLDANGNPWDYQFSKMSETQLQQNVTNWQEIITYIDDLTERFSNDALLAMFGGNIGNMITLAYIVKPMSRMPSRTVRGSATYEVDANKLNSIVRRIDKLIYDEEDDTSVRVATIVKQFFNTNSPLFESTPVQGLSYDNLKDLVPLLLNGLLFNDAIINKLVTMIYPLVCDLVTDKLLGAIQNKLNATIANWIGDILTSLLTNNQLAIYPNKLGDQIYDNYRNDPAHYAQFSDAIGVLRAAGEDWSKVNVEALHWGVDNAPLNKKADAFVDAFCAAMGGFRLLLITIMCGDEEYENSNRRSGGLSWCGDNQFTEYYDKLLLNFKNVPDFINVLFPALGQQGVILRSQGGYTKLIVPLMRVLGLTEQLSYNDTCTGYLSSKEYHRMVDADGDNCLRLIIEPIVYWVTEVLAKRPFETLWSMLPNLVYFFTRTSSMDEQIDEIDVWCEGASNDASHGNFKACQTLSLANIMKHVHLDLTILGIQTWDSSIAGFLGDKMEMLSSLNGLLNQFVDLKYFTGELGNQLVAAYSNDAGDVVLPNSVEYVSDPNAYPNEESVVYTNENETEFVLTQDDDHPIEYTNHEHFKRSFRIPQIQEAKITSTSTMVNGHLADPNAVGVLNTDWNTIQVENPGVVLLYVLRFVISALGYKYNINQGAEDKSLPTLIECIMRMNSVPELVRDERTGDPLYNEYGDPIVQDMLEKELFQGLNLKDVIYNVMLHPDSAICALLELFYSNETGDKYNSIPYTYGLNEINYHGSVLMNKQINPSLTYGTAVRYTQYWTREYAQDTIGNSGELIQNILLMLGKDEFKDGFGPYIANLLDEKVFNNEIINKLFNLVYKLLGGLNDKVGFDIAAVIEAAIDVTYDPVSLGHTIEDILGYAVPASTTLIGDGDTKWAEVFPTMVETDAFGNKTTVVLDADLDWGFAVDPTTGQNTHKAMGRYTSHDAFLRVLSALLSPAAFAFRYLFMDENLNLLGLIELDAYAGYHYAWIGLLEALSCPNILTYRQYYDKAHAVSAVPGSKIADANAIYYMLAPLGGLIDKIYEDPITNILSLIPNLMFFISIGGLNDLLNNLVHFAYVLLDILKPIVNGYDLLDGLLSNIEIKGYKINLALPLDIDFNALISDLIGVLVGDSIKLGDVQLTLPYIDFHTLCCGKLTNYDSREERMTVRLDSAEGADLLTAALRLVFEVIFMEENKKAVTDLVVQKVGTDENGNPKLDSYDKRTLLQILDQLYTLMETKDVPDMLLFVVYQLVTRLTPLSGSLAKSLAASGMTITDLFGQISNPQAFIGSLGVIVNNMGLLGPAVDDDGTISNPAAAGNLFARLIAFFERIIDFFRHIFGMG